MMLVRGHTSGRAMAKLLQLTGGRAYVRKAAESAGVPDTNLLSNWKQLVMR